MEIEKITETSTVETAAELTAAFGPRKLLDDLAAAQRVDGSADRCDELRLDQIEILAELFQPRGVSEKHISELTRAITNFGKVDAVTVFPAGDRIVLIDGHHRIAAYERAGVKEGIPVRYFSGTAKEALLEAGRANSQVKLPMAAQERQNFAWRLVQVHQHSKAEIARASGVSKAQVANMRTVATKLGADAFAYGSWFQAREAAKGTDEALVDADVDAYRQQLAERFADRLAREFSTKLADNVEVAAMALDMYFGRRLTELVNELRSFVAEQDDDDDAF